MRWFAGTLERGALALTALFMMLTLTGCQSTYYNLWEKLGYHKRDILVERVGKARDGQQEAKEKPPAPSPLRAPMTNQNAAID